MDVAIVADDLTGAADAAVEFAGPGRRVAVGLKALVDDPVDVLAVDVDSRERAPEEAAQRVAAAVRGITSQAPRRWFKKMDSTLRGNVAAEIVAFQVATAAAVVVVAPAFPAQQRNYIGGSLQDDGDPLTSSVVRHHLPTMLALGGGGAPALLSLQLIRDGVAAVSAYLTATAMGALIVADAVDDADLDVIVAGAEASGRAVAYAGSAGLAAALARAHGVIALDPPRLRGRREVLFLVGSLQPASRRQLQVAMEQLGGPIVVGPGGLPEGPPPLAAVRRQLRRQHPGATILATPSVAEGDPRDIADATTDVAAALIRSAGVQRVFVTGGDLARALCERLGITRLLAEGQVLPGIPALTAVDGMPGLNLVTKAGGFGPDDTLLHVYEYLAGQEGQGG